ncbi:MAG: DUF448 domain-containing protein [Deltaproteobacteria bacterium]|nr:MAG: DUF448 domain-containing protein [Deltaproteobacteria bacterium]RLB83404.1 MAG: DUF448 domain-containing protein [Deltaproteobacteria bacterium]
MSKGKGHIPIRTCIACGAKKEKKDLIRLVVDADGWVVIDTSGHASGRGAYVCKNKDCWTAVHKHKILSRAFRGRGRLAIRPGADDEVPLVREG